MKNLVVAFAFLGVLLGAITMGGPGEHADVMRATRGTLLPIPDGFCALSNEDGEGGHLFKKSRFEPAAASVRAIMYFAECDQLKRWQKEKAPIDRFGVYSAVQGEFATSDVTRDAFLTAMADYLGSRETPNIEDALNRVRAGAGVVDLGLVHRDDGAAYAAVLLGGPEGDEAVQVHLTAYTKSMGLQYVLHLSAPFETEVTIRDLVALQKQSIDRIIEGG